MMTVDTRIVTQWIPKMDVEAFEECPFLHHPLNPLSLNFDLVEGISSVEIN